MAHANGVDSIKNFTKSAGDRLLSMANALAVVENTSVPGDIVECGVWRGGNIMLARILAPSRLCWLFDTFDGMTEPGEFDTKRGGERAIDRYRLKQAGGTKWDAVSLDDVIEGFYENGLYDPDKLRFIVGPVEQTLPLLQLPDRIAILRLDMDWHAPTKAALEFLYPHLVVGGYLIVDDYGHWMGCKKAVDDYFGDAAPPHQDADYSCRVFRRW